MPDYPSLPHQVYIIRSIPYPSQTYIGYTTDFTTRLFDHNRGHSAHTAKYLPWRPEVVISLPEKQTALALEEYLKSHSGKAFANKRLLRVMDKD